jgi:hypothetical protein
VSPLVLLTSRESPVIDLVLFVPAVVGDVLADRTARLAP